MRYFQSFKVSLYKILIIYKGERVNLQLEMPGRDSLKQVTTVNIISKVTNQIMFPDRWQWEDQCHFCYILNKYVQSESNNAELSDNPKLRDKTTTFTNFKILKVKERLRKFSRLMETNKTGLINEMPILNWFCSGTNDET